MSSSGGLESIFWKVLDCSCEEEGESYLTSILDYYFVKVMETLSG